MVADALTKLATAEVIGVLLAAMDSQLPKTRRREAMADECTRRAETLPGQA